jgi:predicted GIY-YIG superfamily endonuclease
MAIFVYILRCRDGSYYVGTTRDSLDRRVAEHNAGSFGGYTSARRPVQLVFHQEFDRFTDAIAAERQVKGWRRAKKEALIRGDYAALPELARGWTKEKAWPALRPSTGAPRASSGEDHSFLHR